MDFNFIGNCDLSLIKCHICDFTIQLNRCDQWGKHFGCAVRAVQPLLLESKDGPALRTSPAGLKMFATSVCRRKFRTFSGQPGAIEAPTPVEFEPTRPIGMETAADKNYSVERAEEYSP